MIAQRLCTEGVNVRTIPIIKQSHDRMGPISKGLSLSLSEEPALEIKIEEYGHYRITLASSRLTL